MSISLSIARPKPNRQTTTPSIREVCLLGTVRSVPRWVPEDRVSVSGRVYRVSAIAPRAGRAWSVPRYVHLAASVEG